jgi:hypothetical protein
MAGRKRVDDHDNRTKYLDQIVNDPENEPETEVI